jgi:DNA-binding NtrC family response regulator
MSHILLVEDDPDVLALFEEVLLGAGYQVDTADTFQAANDLLAFRDYALLLSDGWLSDGTGIKLADRAKLKGIPSLIVTAYIDKLHQPGSPISWANYTVLPKPVTPRALVDGISRILHPS